MATLRCTAKLLKRLKTAPLADPPPPTTMLGDWTANLIHLGRWQLVLAVNDATRLGVAINAAPFATVAERLVEAIADSLRDLGIAEQDVIAECLAMRALNIGAKGDRSVLGTLTRYYFDLEAWHFHEMIPSAQAINRRLLDELVLEPRHIGRPADRVRECFDLPPMPRRRWGEAANDAYC